MSTYSIKTFDEVRRKHWWSFAHFTKTKRLISINIVKDDGREISLLCKDFNLKQAWERSEIIGVFKGGDIGNVWERYYDARQTILLPIYEKYVSEDIKEIFPFNLNTMRIIFKKYGLSYSEVTAQAFEFLFYTP